MKKIFALSFIALILTTTSAFAGGEACDRNAAALSAAETVIEFNSNVYGVDSDGKKFVVEIVKESLIQNRDGIYSVTARIRHFEYTVSIKLDEYCGIASAQVGL